MKSMPSVSIRAISPASELARDASFNIEAYDAARMTSLCRIAAMKRHHLASLG